MSVVDGEDALPPLLGDDDRVAVAPPTAGRVDAVVGLGIDATGCRYYITDITDSCQKIV